MDPQDARKLSAESLEDLRRRAVAAVESGCLPQAEVARLFGVSRQTLSAWVRAYRRHGELALRPRRRGRRPGDQLVLSYTQQLWAVQTVTTRTPDQAGLHHLVWSRRALTELIRAEFRIQLGVCTVRNYLTRWGFTTAGLVQAHRPAGGPAVLPDRLWVAGDPAAAGTARALGTETLWTHCTRMRWSVPVQGGVPPGTRPAAPRDVDILLAVSSRGAVFFLPTPDPYDGARVCDFLTRLIRHRGQRLAIVPGWQPTRQAELLGTWIAANTERRSAGVLAPRTAPARPRDPAGAVPPER